ncbi:glycine zipper 2TM domain-containing protein [Oxalobacteraceae bacterium A2-2]
METTTTVAKNRIHPLVATAAVSLTIVSLVGAAAIAGLLPNSRGASTGTPADGAPLAAAAPLTAAAPATAAAPVTPAVQQPAPAPVVREVVRYKTVVKHDAPRRTNASYEDSQYAQADAARDARPAPAPQQAQNSALGMGIGALVGGLVGNQVGSGHGRTLATIAGAVGGGYVGNEIAKRNQTAGQ